MSSKVTNEKNQEGSPFVCQTKIKEPLGLPPIRKSFEFPIIKTVDNYYDRQNKDIIREIENVNKSEILIDEEMAMKSEFKRAYDVSLKRTLNLNELRRQLYGDLIVKKKKKYRKGKTLKNFYNKIDPIVEEPKIKINEQNLISDLEDKNEELDNMLNFVNNLDYDKYTQDLETREAIYLLKNKFEKDKEKFVPNNEEPNNEENLNNEKIEIKNEEDARIETETKNKFYLPPCTLATSSTIVNHEKEWNCSVYFI